MATKQQQSVPYAAGIFADMTVDGPEIGTLVMVCDRAKNLPNRKTMGKQNPYCAARLGKEAKKTNVDKRGGQTPKWDTELRFTVHDSADYYNIKISVFSEDKKTDLIGEAHVDLSAVIVAGGGTNDVWQGLTCKGKYAGEIRLEFTFYDSRPKPERTRKESNAATEDVMVAPRPKQVKRRPLPGSAASVATAESIVDFPTPTSRVRNGPRELGTPPRANSMPPETMMQQPGFAGSPAQFHTPPPGHHQQDPHGQYDEPHDEMPDFLPQLPPTPRRQGGPQGPVPMAAHGHMRGQSQGMLPHAHSAPIVPTLDQEYGQGYGLHTDAPEPLADLNYQHQRMRQRRNDVPPDWENPYDDPYHGQQYHEEPEEDYGPPPPPMHTHSAPIIPQRSPAQAQMDGRYNGMSTPPSARQQYIPNASPLQGIERGYSSPQHTPPPHMGARGRSNEDFTPSPPHSRGYDSPPAGMTHNNMSSPGMRSPVSRGVPNRHSMADIYQTSPARPHPLSKEVPRARSPMPPFAEHGDQGRVDHQHAPRGREDAPMAMPRALSPVPPPASAPPQAERPTRSTYPIQFPVRAFESSDGSPLSTGRPYGTAVGTPQRPLRKSVSPRPSPTDTTIVTPGGGAPFSPDSYDVHNTSSPMPSNHSANAPFQTRSDAPRDGPGGPIVGWDGREIDPSDHLPVDSWAPEPEKKAPTKTYGLGRDRDFGPRSQGGSASGSPAGQRLSNDTVINFRRRSQAVPSPQQSIPEQQASPASPARNRMYRQPSPNPSPRAEPLRERPNFNSTPPSSAGGIPDPYAQDYTRGFYDGSPGFSGGEVSRYDRKPQQQALGYGGYGGDANEDAISREIAGIDLGAHTGSTRRMPTVSHSHSGSAAGSVSGWQGVRSHRDRGFY